MARHVSDVRDGSSHTAAQQALNGDAVIVRIWRLHVQIRGVEAGLRRRACCSQDWQSTFQRVSNGLAVSHRARRGWSCVGQVERIVGAEVRVAVAFEAAVEDTESAANNRRSE